MLIGETSLKSSALRLESMLSGVSHDMLGDAVSESPAPHMLFLHNVNDFIWFNLIWFDYPIYFIMVYYDMAY